MAATFAARSHRAKERGAAAVEMAIVLPLLLLLIGGLVDFGRLFYDRALYANAARDGVRLASLKQGQAVVKQRTKDAALPRTVNVRITDAAGVDVDPTTCAPLSQINVVVTPVSAFRWTMLDVVPSLVGWTLAPPTVDGKATMTCG